jgi:hypothetical protein
MSLKDKRGYSFHGGLQSSDTDHLYTTYPKPLDGLLVRHFRFRIEPVRLALQDRYYELGRMLSTECMNYEWY